MPCWWMELSDIPGVEDPRKLAQKIQASFSIPAVRSNIFPGQGYTALPAPKCLTQSVFLPDELSYQDMGQQPFLLTVAYAQGLQYWAERLNLPVDPDFHPLARSVLELRERVKEHVIFSKQDIIQGLGRICKVIFSFCYFSCNNGWNWSKDLNRQKIFPLTDKLLQANMAASSGLRENVYSLIFFAKMLVYIILLFFTLYYFQGRKNN